MDGGFCLYCVLFCDKVPGRNSSIKTLLSEPATHWNDAVACFKRHQNKPNGIHSLTSELFSTFIKNMTGKAQPIDVIIDKTYKKKIQDNRNF